MMCDCWLLVEMSAVVEAGSVEHGLLVLVVAERKAPEQTDVGLPILSVSSC
jgi:hypothetical protein